MVSTARRGAALNGRLSLFVSTKKEGQVIADKLCNALYAHCIYHDDVYVPGREPVGGFRDACAHWVD
jgi:hypothetical protein